MASLARVEERLPLGHAGALESALGVGLDPSTFEHVTPLPYRDTSEPLAASVADHHTARAKSGWALELHDHVGDLAAFDLAPELRWCQVGQGIRAHDPDAEVSRG